MSSAWSLKGLFRSSVSPFYGIGRLSFFLYRPLMEAKKDNHQYLHQEIVKC